MTLIAKTARYEIWACRERHGVDYYVYGLCGDPRVCPSLDMARSIAAGI